MLMRSPAHPSLMRWALRDEPAGRHRFVIAYLTVAAGTGTSLVIMGITVLTTRSCQFVSGVDPGCMAGFFHGLGLSILGGLTVTCGLAVFVKLGLRFVAGLLALAAPVLLITQLFSIFGAEPRPYVLIALIGVPAAASWLSGLLRPDPDPQPAALTASPVRTTARC